PVVMEMGSKNPTIVTSKADLKKAVEGVARAAYGYDGQKCSATSRVYVQAAIKSSFLEELKSRVQQLGVGDPREKGTFIGPVINKTAVSKFRSAVQEVRRGGWGSGGWWGGGRGGGAGGRVREGEKCLGGLVGVESRAVVGGWGEDGDDEEGGGNERSDRQPSGY